MLDPSPIGQIEGFDYTRISDKRRAMHVLVCNPQTGLPVQTSGGSIIAPDPNNNNPIVLALSTEKVTLSNGPTPLSETAYYCNSVQVQSIRSDMTDNTARIGVGNQSDWGNAIDPGGVLGISSPQNGTIDLSTIYLHGPAGHQVSLLIME